MRQKTAVSSVRRNLTLPDDFMEQLLRLRVQTQSASGSEVIRRALTCFEEFLEESENNRHVRITSAGEEPIVIDLKNFPEPPDQKLVKVNLIFHDGSEVSIDKLRDITRLSTDSEIVRKALRLYDILVTSYSEGKSLQLIDRDGNIETLKIWGVPRRPLRPQSSPQPPAQKVA